MAICFMMIIVFLEKHPMTGEVDKSATKFDPKKAAGNVKTVEAKDK